MNEQVKGATAGKLDIYDVDKMIHSLLGKKENEAGFSLLNF